MLTVLGFLPYLVLGMVMVSLQIEMNQWQWWTLWACLIATDAITYLKANSEG